MSHVEDVDLSEGKGSSLQIRAIHLEKKPLFFVEPRRFFFLVVLYSYNCQNIELYQLKFEWLEAKNIPDPFRYSVWGSLGHEKCCRWVKYIIHCASAVCVLLSLNTCLSWSSIFIRSNCTIFSCHKVLSCITSSFFEDKFSKI